MRRAGGQDLACGRRIEQQDLGRPSAPISRSTNAGGSALSPARISATVRGRGSGGGGRLTLASATRRASVTVRVRQMDGLLADRASKSVRPRRSTRLSRSAVTVAVRAPPARKAISPTGWPGPSSAIGARLPSSVTTNRPVTMM